jgi:hypothetical protein
MGRTISTGGIYQLESLDLEPLRAGDNTIVAIM